MTAPTAHEHQWSRRLIVEALVCGLPASLLAAFFLPHLLFVATGNHLNPPWFFLGVLTMLVCSGFALTQYWLLVVNTLRHMPYRFGKAFVAAILCAVALQITFMVFLPPLSLPGFLVALSAVHFGKVQRLLAATRL